MPFQDYITQFLSSRFEFLNTITDIANRDGAVLVKFKPMDDIETLKEEIAEHIRSTEHPIKFAVSAHQLKVGTVPHLVLKFTEE